MGGEIYDFWSLKKEHYLLFSKWFQSPCMLFFTSKIAVVDSVWLSMNE